MRSGLRQRDPSAVSYMTRTTQQFLAREFASEVLSGIVALRLFRRGRRIGSGVGQLDPSAVIVTRPVPPKVPSPGVFE